MSEQPQSYRVDGQVGAGDVVAACPHCGGTLKADRYFELFERATGKPERREPFWSTTCERCHDRCYWCLDSGRVFWFAGNVTLVRGVHLTEEVSR